MEDTIYWKRRFEQAKLWAIILGVIVILLSGLLILENSFVTDMEREQVQMEKEFAELSSQNRYVTDDLANCRKRVSEFEEYWKP